MHPVSTQFLHFRKSFSLQGLRFYCIGLENRYTERYRGFESLLLRWWWARKGEDYIVVAQTDALERIIGLNFNIRAKMMRGFKNVDMVFGALLLYGIN